MVGFPITRSNSLMATNRVPSPSHLGSSLIAESLNKISTSPENHPVNGTGATSENYNYRGFSSDSVHGKPLAEVNLQQQIGVLYNHLYGGGATNTVGLHHFTQVMNQGGESCIKTSNIQNGTKAALALFSLLSESDKGVVKDKAKDLYNAMDQLLKDPGSNKLLASADKKLKEFNSAIFIQMGLTEGPNREDKLNVICEKYLKQCVLTDIVAKLSGVVSADQLQRLQGEKSEVIETLYTSLNKKNEANIQLLKDGFFAHQKVRDKADQFHRLIEALESKTEFIAGIQLENAVSELLASPPNASTPLQAPPQAAPRSAPTSAPTHDYYMGSAATPASGANPLTFAPVNQFSPTISLGLGEVLSPLLAPLISVVNSLADQISKVSSSPDLLFPGGESSRHANRSDVGTQTPVAAANVNTQTEPEANDGDRLSTSPLNVFQKQTDIETLIVDAQPKIVIPVKDKVEEPVQANKTVSNQDAVLITQKVPMIEDETDSVATPSAAVSPGDTPPEVSPKKSAYALNSQGTLFGTQGGKLPLAQYAPVDSTNGAISGSSESTRYRNNYPSQAAQKNASSTDSQMADPLKSNGEENAEPTRLANTADSKLAGIGDAQDRAYALNSQGTFFGTQGGKLPLFPYKPAALTDGAISGSTESTRYRNSTSQAAQKSAEPSKLVNSAGSAFAGMRGAQGSSEFVDLLSSSRDNDAEKVHPKPSSLRRQGSNGPSMDKLTQQLINTPEAEK
ncbi:hypothetical protein [Yersinia bercovieri]|uniref:hypothetical protein n=1 Tax=Yersinia bercovieri TaxID=634 RepID=UPI0011AB8E7C|nr:hypothetical protein [Yersinia bercovieri]